MKGSITDFKEILKALNQKVASLPNTVSERGAEISRLNRLDSLHQKDMHAAKMKIAALEKENAEIKERLSKYEKPEKDSHNSSIPPFTGIS